MRHKELVAAITVVFRELNVFSSNQDAAQSVVNAFSATHRTLQQSFVRIVIIPILQRLADDYEHGACDGRNRDACALASRMLKDMTDDDLHLPFI